MGTADHPRSRRPTASTARAAPQLETPDIIPIPNVSGLQWHSASVLSSPANARRAKRRAGSGHLPDLLPEIRSILPVEHAVPTSESHQRDPDSTSALGGPRSHQTVDPIPFPPDRL